MKGVRFPGSLIMLSKVMFTLDGILTDIGGMSSNIGFAIARQLAGHWRSDRHAFRSPLDGQGLGHTAVLRVALYHAPLDAL